MKQGFISLCLSYPSSTPDPSARIRHTTRLLLAIITTRLDYCNCLLLEGSSSHIQPHVTPSLQQLRYWLPIIQVLVQFKLCTLVYGVHSKQWPAYYLSESDVVQSVASTSTRDSLRFLEGWDVAWLKELLPSPPLIERRKYCVARRHSFTRVSVSADCTPQ